jgi:hypothetical protein
MVPSPPLVTMLRICVEFEVTAREHLVQSHVVHQHGIALGGLGHGVDHLAHKQRALGGMGVAVDDLLFLYLIKGVERLSPLRVAGLLHQLVEHGEALLAVAHHGHVGLHVLVNLTGIDVEVYDLGLLGIGLQRSRHAVVEAHTDGDEHVTLLLLEVGA